MAILPINRFLTDDGLEGDGTNQSANRNGSVTAVPFYAGPRTGVWEINRMLILIEDNAVIAADDYGGVSVLTNGVSIDVKEGGSGGTVLQDMTDGFTIKSNVHWAGLCYDMTEHTFGSGNNFIVVRWSFSRSGQPIILNSNRNENLVVTVNDDLTGLVEHNFLIQGRAAATKNDLLDR